MLKKYISRLAFHRSGKPRGWVRALAFDGRHPKPHFHRLAYKKSGRVRGAFQTWVEGPRPASTEQVAHVITRSIQVPFRVDFDAATHGEDDLLVFVAYCRDDELSELQQQCLKTYREAGYDIALVINAEHLESSIGVADSVVQAGYAQTVIVRENKGYDFSAWSHFLAISSSWMKRRSITFTNDSILPVTMPSIRDMRHRVHGLPHDVVFMTENLEIKPHGQSYLFSVKRSAVTVGALSVLDDIPLFAEKQALIEAYEIELARLFAERGVSVGYAFELESARTSGKNPTIHHWEELLAEGFPFLKLQLITSRFLEVTDARLARHLDPRTLGMISRHLDRRGVTAQDARSEPRQLGPVPALVASGRFNAHGVLQTWNPTQDSAINVRLPLKDIAARSVSVKAVTAVIHCYYVDVAESLLRRIAACDPAKCSLEFFCLLTTDSAEKADILSGLLVRLGLSGKVQVHPNRGRDVAPFLAACRDVQTEFLLHLHTKRSPHDSCLGGWAPYLFESLLPSDDAMKSLSLLMEQPSVGLIYPAHFSVVHERRNWGYDFDGALRLAKSMGLALDADMPLDFPTGTMFWARTEALRKLLDLGLTSADFEPEAGQEDGTLAHSIERLIQHVVEDHGCRAVKYVRDDISAEAVERPVDIRADMIKRLLSEPFTRLSTSRRSSTRFSREFAEVPVVGFARSGNGKKRINVLIPTAHPAKIYGGVSTALRVAKGLFDATKSCDLRVIVTTDAVGRDSLAEISRRMGRSFVQCRPGQDVSGCSVVDFHTRSMESLSLRDGEEFFATAWWTADLGFRAMDAIEQWGGGRKSLAYLIQDYEPGFYAWSDKCALAEATYHRPDQTLAILNSEELANFMQVRYRFPQAFVLPYTLSPELKVTGCESVRERIILCYGRPTVERNAFSSIVEGIRLWQARHPSLSQQWQVMFAGESFDESLLVELVNARCLGKLTLDAYSTLLQKASIGISMMISPHPSYPPLEMASAGLKVIANRYDGKDLAIRSSNVCSIDVVSPHLISKALERLVDGYSADKSVGSSDVGAVPCDTPVYQPSAVVGLLGL